MDFDKILNNTSPEAKDSLTVQALKRQEYNRQYQARLRQRAKLITLERKVDNNLTFVIGYIKKRYATEYANYVEPVAEPEVEAPSFPAFTNWLMLSAGEYKSVKEAFELSGLKEHMKIAEFTKLFKQSYKENNTGSYVKD